MKRRKIETKKPPRDDDHPSEDPQGSRTPSLFAGGRELRLKKLHPSSACKSEPNSTAVLGKRFEANWAESPAQIKF